MGSKRPARYIPDEQRFRLRYGPYNPPVIKGGYLVDVVRGKLPFSHFSNGRIPWPIAKRRGPAGSGGYILCCDLVRALKLEAAAAISYHWGVCSETVTKWKTLAEAPVLTKGAKVLMAIGREYAVLPEVRVRMSQAACRRSFRQSLKKSLIRGARRRYHAAAQARHAAYQKTGKFPRVKGNKVPWIPEEEKFLGKKTVDELVVLLGRTLEAIVARHSFHKIRVKFPPNHLRWNPEHLKLVGSAPDAEIAAKTGRSLLAVQAMRRKKRIVGKSFAFPKRRQ